MDIYTYLLKTNFHSINKWLLRCSFTKNKGFMALMIHTYLGTGASFRVAVILLLPAVKSGVLLRNSLQGMGQGVVIEYRKFSKNSDRLAF
jgi:hypothetical protein